MNFAFSLGELAKSCVEFRALFMKSSGIMRKTIKLSNKTVKFVIQDQRVSHMAGFSRRLKIRQTSIKYYLLKCFVQMLLKFSFKSILYEDKNRMSCKLRLFYVTSITSSVLLFLRVGRVSCVRVVYVRNGLGTK